jgi:hypothetical protein
MCFFFLKTLNGRIIEIFLIFKIQKPDVFSIPRGNLEIEPDVELTEEERRMKEKRMLEIKKMIAIQSLQQLNVDEQNGNSNHYVSSSTSSHNSNINSNSNSNYFDNFEKEKKAREQVTQIDEILFLTKANLLKLVLFIEKLLDLTHELAEQIKEKTRQHALANSSLNGSNGNGSSSMSPASVDLENRITGNFLKTNFLFNQSVRFL